MLYIVSAASIGAFLFSMILLCCSKGAAKKDRVKRRLDTLGREATQAALKSDIELEKPFAERVIRPILQKIMQLFSNLLPRGKHKDNKNEEQQKRLLQQAGWTITVEEYNVIRLILMAGAGILGLVLGLILKNDVTDAVLYFFLGAFAAYALLRYVVTSAAASRREAMEKQLPDLLDLLSVSVAAGLGFERAMLHVTESMDGPLVDEFAVSYREMSMGRTRKDALTLLGERCGIEDLISVTGALVQAGQLGIPICNVLESQSAAIRRSRRAKVQEKAAKVSTKMLLPMVGLIFPVLIIILMGPSIITVMEQLG